VDFIKDLFPLRDRPKPPGGIEIGDDMAYAKIFVIAKPPAPLARLCDGRQR
jgi:hypothetical protein